MFPRRRAINYFTPGFHYEPIRFRVYEGSKVQDLIDQFCERTGLGFKWKVAYLPKDHALDIQPELTINRRFINPCLEYLDNSDFIFPLQLCGEDTLKDKLQFFILIDTDQPLDQFIVPGPEEDHFEIIQHDLSVKKVMEAKLL
ncbi:hypothetical protein OG21DRAFT_1455940 [Imleria badia]|nr:hypothetical protein OG21DRAFT_1455940 [Imleria badia]